MLMCVIPLTCATSMVGHQFSLHDEIIDRLHVGIVHGDAVSPTRVLMLHAKRRWFSLRTLYIRWLRKCLGVGANIQITDNQRRLDRSRINRRVVGGIRLWFPESIKQRENLLTAPGRIEGLNKKGGGHRLDFQRKWDSNGIYQYCSCRVRCVYFFVEKRAEHLLTRNSL